MKQRIRYFDLAKGFLMILVVLHHIHMHGAKILGDLSVSVFLDYADDCLSYGDKEQCRKLYESAMSYYEE